MSRHGYTDDCDDALAMGRWRAQVKSSIRGKRGQKFLRELAESLDAMPKKRLIAEELVKDGEFCTLGVIGAKRGIAIDSIDPDDHEVLGAEFNIPHQLVQEIEYENDKGRYQETPEDRWVRMRAWVSGLIKKEEQDASQC